MRNRSENEAISVRAISGTRVVLLGLDIKGIGLPEMMARMSLKGPTRPGSYKKPKSMFIGFSITRVDLETDESVSLNEGGKPIQKLLWGDYDVEPGRNYKYVIRQMTNGKGFMSMLEICIKTEDNKGVHSIYFNRSVAGSRAYNNKFEKYRKWHLMTKYGIPVWRNIINPRSMPGPESQVALAWLSRGLEEALLEFISQASGEQFQLRAAVYEFTHEQTIDALADAVQRGVDVKIVRHCKGVYHPKVKRNSIVHDENGKPVSQWIPDTTTDEAAKAIRKVGFDSLEHAKTWHHDTFIERRHSTALMHNKFILLLQEGKPIAVWTGSTNFTDGGIYGQGNVGHVVRDVDVAQQYLIYWNLLSLDTPGRSHRRSSSNESNGEPIGDSFETRKSFQFVEEEDRGGIDGRLCLKPLKSESINDKDKHSSMDSAIETLQPDLDGPLKSESINVIFSPRKTTAMLQFYADRMRDATTSVHLTAPFGVPQQFAKVLCSGKGHQDGVRRSPRIAKRYTSTKETTQTDLSTNVALRYILFDRKPSENTSKKARESANKKGKEYVDYFDFRDVKENKVAYGAVLSDEENDLDEDLTGLTSFVDFVHLKIMLIDALTDNPTVITGSANFSEASTDRNDENMLVIHGDCSVADIYLTEYMRLFNHFHSRDHHVSSTHPEWGQIVNDESWLKSYFDPTNQLYCERMLFR